MNKIKIIDSTLRDGNHTIDNRFNLNDIKILCKELDDANVDFIEVGYGYGLSSFSREGYPSDEEIIKAALSSVTKSEITLLIFPDKCELSDLEKVANWGIKNIRIATQASNFNPGIPFVQKANSLNINVGAFLMMSHKVNTEELLSQAKLAKEYGANNICMTDSAGAMAMDEVREKIETLVNELNLPIGFHTHDSLGLAIGNSILAIESGASTIDTALNGFGAGAGNAPTETLVAVMNKMNIPTNADLFKLLDASKTLAKIVAKYDMLLKSKEDTLIIGYSGVYSTFINLAKNLSQEYDISYRELLNYAATKNLIPGEEEKLIDLAVNLKSNISKS